MSEYDHTQYYALKAPEMDTGTYLNGGCGYL